MIGSAAAGSPWSAQQRRWLQALGHAVLRVGEVDVEEVPAGADAGVAEAGGALAVPGREPAGVLREQAPARGIGAQLEQAAPPRRGPAMVQPAAPPTIPVKPVTPEAGAAAATARVATRRPAPLPDRLQLAMLRASGLDPAGPDAQAAMAEWPVDRLRGDGAAKRAFWPRLRVLRRRPS